MAITSVSEFEAVIGQAIIKIGRVLDELGDDPALKQVRRDLRSMAAVAREPAELKALRDKLDAGSEVIRVKMKRHEDLHNDMWDCLDFIDFRC